MILFWSLAALLVAGALLCVMPPLLKRGVKSAATAAPNNELNVAVYRDQQRELEADRSAGTISDVQYERARLELERGLLEDVAAEQTQTPQAQPTSRTAAIIAGFALPVVAVALYFAVGSPRALVPVQLPADAGQGVTAEQVEAMVTKLAERMKQNPDDPQGWAMLGKAYGVLRRFEDAAAAYAQAVARVPDNPHLLADYADALAMTRGQNLLGEPEALVERALKIDPDHGKSLALAGSIAFEKKDYAGAIRHWERLVAQVPPDGEIAREVRSGIAEARSLSGDKGTPVVAKGGGVSGTVALAPALAAKVAPGDTVFIFARAAEGPRMPLAIVRKKVSDLPAAFTLDDSMAMSPQSRLSDTPKVIIGARVSKGGDAMARPGDLQGFSSPMNNSATGVTIVIDTEVR